MIIFQNDGVVPIEAFNTFGMSAKPGSDDPIGKFGTGLKYAVAVTLRLGGTFKLWRGDQEYEFFLQPVDFRGTEFQRVVMKHRGWLSAMPWNQEVLPFTTELGKHWEPWMAVRELEANCRDENGMSFISEIGSQSQHTNYKNQTFIAIDCPEMEEAFERLDEIFLPKDRELVFEEGGVRAYKGTSNYIFHRGMRVTDLRQPSMLTYELDTVVLTEDRTSQYPFLDAADVRNALLRADDEEVVASVIECPTDSYEGTLDWDNVEKTTKGVSEAWPAQLRSRTSLAPRFSSMRDNLQYGLADDAEVSVDFSVTEWLMVAQALREHGLAEENAADKIMDCLKEAGWVSKAWGDEGDA